MPGKLSELMIETGFPLATSFNLLVVDLGFTGGSMSDFKFTGIEFASTAIGILKILSPQLAPSGSTDLSRTGAGSKAYTCDTNVLTINKQKTSGTEDNLRIDVNGTTILTHIEYVDTTTLIGTADTYKFVGVNIGGTGTVDYSVSCSYAGDFNGTINGNTTTMTVDDSDAGGI